MEEITASLYADGKDTAGKRKENNDATERGRIVRATC